MEYIIYYLYDKRDAKKTPVYVGQTSQPLHERLLGHRQKAHRGEGSHVYYYMRNQGIQNFDIVEIIKCNKEEALTQEAVAIQLLNPQCNKQRITLSSYPTMALYKKAWREQNIQDERFKCTVCGKCSGDNHRLKEHMKIHF